MPHLRRQNFVVSTSKIEGEYICDTCHNKIDMETNKEEDLTMQGFREYLVFYDQNQLLKGQFVISQRIDFGFWDTKIIFDYQNKLFCMSKNPDKTVFEGKQLKSFTIKEDSTPLFEGSAAGIRRYASTVPERAMAMAPQIAQYMMNRQMARALDKLDDGKQNRSAPMPYFDVPEPFQVFNVELHFDHPYWTVIKCDMDGPRFNNNCPDVNDYIRSYQRSIEEIEKLVTAFKTVAFPETPDQSIGLGAAGAKAVHTTTAFPVDAIEEIKKYKALMDEGIISQQEFDAKKRQLLGI
nr:SHOCT domain-containing protein [Desulforamulus aquiferis]